MPTPLPPLRLLTVFETVLRKGGIGKASAALNVSQPAVSQALKALEAHLGTALLDRRTRPPGLTEAGRLLHRATVEALGRITEAVEEIERLASSRQSSATVACSVGVATYWLMPRLASFYDRHPEIAVNVLTTSHGAPGFGPGVDIAIRFGTGTWSDGAVRPLFEEMIEPVCSPVLIDRFGTADGALMGAALIHVDVDDASWVTWPRYLATIGQACGARRAPLHFTNYVQATQAALNHQGVMLGWRSITGDLVKEGRLATLPSPPLKPRDAFFLVLGPEAISKPSVAAVAAWLADAT